MRTVSLAALLLATSSASAAQPVDATTSREPYEWVRTMETVQEQIATGSRAAHDYLPKLIVDIADAIEKTPLETALEPRNVRAVIAFTLSGGSGKPLRRLLGSSKLSPTDDELAKGALAYTEGKYSVASKHLEGLDARKLDPSLAGRVALTQAILMYKSNPKKAISLLDTCRLLSVGSLVEEAALRRQVVLQASVSEHERFEWLALQYFYKFKKSIYARFFMEQFSVAAATLDYSGPEHRVDRMRAIVDLLDESDQMVLLLLLAERAAFLGNLPVIEFAAGSAVEKAKPASIERNRAELYLASAHVLSEKVESAMSTLRGLPREKLGTADRQLRDAVISVGDEVTRPAQDSVPVTGEENSASDVGAVLKDEGSAGDYTILAESVRAKLAAADKLLERRSK